MTRRDKWWSVSSLCGHYFSPSSFGGTAREPVRITRPLPIAIGLGNDDDDDWYHYFLDRKDEKTIHDTADQD